MSFKTIIFVLALLGSLALNAQDEGEAVSMESAITEAIETVYNASEELDRIHNSISKAMKAHSVAEMQQAFQSTFNPFDKAKELIQDAEKLSDEAGDLAGDLECLTTNDHLFEASSDLSSSGSDLMEVRRIIDWMEKAEDAEEGLFIIGEVSDALNEFNEYFLQGIDELNKALENIHNCGQDAEEDEE